MENFGFIIAPETPEGDYLVGKAKEELKKRGINYTTILYKDKFVTKVFLPENPLSPENLYVGHCLYELQKNGIKTGMLKLKDYAMMD